MPRMAAMGSPRREELALRYRAARRDVYLGRLDRFGNLDAAADRGQLRENRDRDLRGRLRADFQADRTAQAPDLRDAEIEFRQPLASGVVVLLRAERADVKRRGLERFQQRRVVELGIVRHGDHGAVRVEIHLHDHVVGITAIDGNGVEIPAIGVLGARIAHRDVIVERVRHLREVTRDLPRADDEKTPARAVHGLEHLAVELEQVGPFARLDAYLARIHVEEARGKLVTLDDPEELFQPGFRGHGLENDLQRTAAGQSIARRLLLGYAVGGDFGFRCGERLALYLVDEVVLDAAPGNRAHHLAVVADDQHRAHGPRCRAPGVHHRPQGSAVAALGPLQSAAHHLEINAVHGIPFVL